MTTPPKRWTTEHFSQANPTGAGQSDVPALLRRVADSIEGYGPVDVHDLILHNEVTADGDWPSLTVYFTRQNVDSGEEVVRLRTVPTSEPPANQVP